MDVPIVWWQRHCSRVTTIRHHPVFPFGGSIVEDIYSAAQLFQIIQRHKQSLIKGQNRENYEMFYGRPQSVVAAAL